ncbi:MAG: D-glycero-beta-D-manno-heptose 1,7-bisphosphate 7-phosphatase [Thermodesulfobacteriota bacterium]|nr:D-glycero-beta-D-manno-heptose 1,7-bisphosphate 7-phosphatase [Thermodesulfobacteriota bacterium]
MKKNKAVFLDRDGTINEEVSYLDSLEQLRIFPAAFDAVRMINEAGMKAVVITNQSGVARGLFDEDFVNAAHTRINEMLQKKGSFIDRFYYCPHHPTEGGGVYKTDCDCRKPEPGMILMAAEEMDIDLSKSYMVGDMPKDIEAARAAGVKGILVRTEYGEKGTYAGSPVYVARDILDAVNWIMKDQKK